MKVLTSPFETPRDFTADVVADVTSEATNAASISPPKAASGASDVGRGMDSATRESLARLSQLIRSQMKASDAADEAVRAEAVRDEEEQMARAARNARAVKALSDIGADEAILKERVSIESYPSVARLEKKFEDEARKRGARIYGEQKTKDSVRQILFELGSIDSAAIADDDDEGSTGRAA